MAKNPDTNADGDAYRLHRPDVDAIVAAHAERRGATKEAILRLFLDAGLAHVEFGSPLPALKEQPTTARHIPCSPSLDETFVSNRSRAASPKTRWLLGSFGLGMVSLQG